MPTISKTEAIRHAIDKIGPTATLKAIHDFASKEYGLDISPSHISKIRSELSEKKGKKAPAEARKESVSKTDAVKQALAKLGKKAKPAAIHDFVASEFGLEIGLGHISNIKSTLKKTRKRTAKPEPVAAVTHANGKPARETGVSLADIEATKQLAERVGVKQLHALIDLVAK